MVTGYDSSKIESVHVVQQNGCVLVNIVAKSGLRGWVNDIVTGLPTDYRPFYYVYGSRRINTSADDTINAFAQLTDDGKVSFYFSNTTNGTTPFSFTFPYNKSI